MRKKYADALRGYGDLMTRFPNPILPPALYTGGL
jgi:hypothetical protein